MQAHTIYDDAVIGGGINGLAHAWQLARRKRRVVVIDRNRAERGDLLLETGGVRFIDQLPGEHLELALRSRTHLLKMLAAAEIWHEDRGSLLLAYDGDEMQALREYVEAACTVGCLAEILSHEEVLSRSPWVRPQGLHGGLWSPTEIAVDPRLLVSQLPAYLTRAFEVQFVYETGAARIENQTLHTTRTPVYARNFWICSEDDLAQLYPEIFRESGLYRVRVQRLRTGIQPDQQRQGPLLAGGLTLLSAPAFRGLPSALALRQRLEIGIDESRPNPVEALATQGADGCVTIGDMRDFDAEPDSPFYNGDSEQLCLRAVGQMVDLPHPAISQRWITHYWKSSQGPFAIARPAENVTVAVGLGDAALALACGVADMLVHEKVYSSQRIDLAVFNLEGTAIIDANGVAACLRDAFFDFGMQLQLSQIQQVMGWPRPAAIRYLIDQSPTHAERLRDQVALIHANFVTRMKRFYMHDPRVQVAPGVMELFRSLRAMGIKVALNSGFNRDLTQTILHRFGWRQGDLFDAVVSSDEVQRGRPFPDMIHELMRRLGIEKPKQVAKIGDSPADIEEGVNAGCGLVVGIASGTHKMEDLRHYRPHHVLERLADLPSLMPREEQPDEV